MVSKEYALAVDSLSLKERRQLVADWYAYCNRDDAPLSQVEFAESWMAAQAAKGGSRG